MKKFILSSLLFLSTLNLYAMSGSTDIQDVNTVTHSCACASDLSQAFSDIQSTIFDDYLLPLKDSFEDPIKAIEKHIETEKEQTPLIKKSNDYYELKIVEALEHLDYLKKTVQINSKN